MRYSVSAFLVMFAMQSSMRFPMCPPSFIDSTFRACPSNGIAMAAISRKIAFFMFFFIGFIGLVV